MATHKALLAKKKILVTEYQEKNVGIYAEIIAEGKPDKRDNLCAQLEAATVVFLRDLDILTKQLLKPAANIPRPPGGKIVL